MKKRKAKNPAKPLLAPGGIPWNKGDPNCTVTIKKGPLWRGPEIDGVTQSLLSRFLVCRERFRVHVVEGLRPAPTFNHRMEYGSMWHTCEEALASTSDGREFAVVEELKNYARSLCQQYPLQQDQINHWYMVCKTQFPVYVDYWAKHPDVKNRVPLLQEETFNVPYTLPSGRVVRLRGKWDSVDLIGKGRAAGVYLQENKTKGDIDEVGMLRQLSSGFDLQTMMYLVALEERRKQRLSDHLVTPYIPDDDTTPGALFEKPIRGVRYNVVRRPLSGGKGNIRRHQATKTKPEETVEEFFGRLTDIIEAEPETYFMRWKVEITLADITRFRHECLDPILEQLCDWWDYIVYEPVHKSNTEQYQGFVPRFPKDPFQNSLEDDSVASPHWRHPFGVWNSLNEGGSSELDEYLNTGSTLGLERAKTLFPELI